MKILYLSCHSVLEYDEIRILSDLGYDVFSIGAYITPSIPHVDMRPSINIPSNPVLLSLHSDLYHRN